MKYTFMHKNIQILDMEIDDKGYIEKIYELYNTNHLPVGIHMLKDSVNRGELNDWWKSRSIPASRNGINWILQQLNISSPQELLIKSFGLSLSDQYWIKPFDKDLKWEDINFFDNDFSEDIGDLLVGNAKDTKNISMLSPDNTSDGNLKKRWKIINGKRFLLKSGSGTLQQEVFNEALASKIMDILDIRHVHYEVMWINNNPYSVCEDFITKEEDLVPAWRLLHSKKMNNSENEFHHLLKLAKENHINDYQEELDKMLVLDYLIANEDRHYNNFGFIRDVETLEYKGFAPIYDNGCSLGYDTMNYGEAFNPNWKPFMTNKVTSQLELVNSFEWLDLNKLNDIESLVNEIYPDMIEYQKRKNEIINLINYRIYKLKEYIINKK